MIEHGEDLVLEFLPSTPSQTVWSKPVDTPTRIGMRSNPDLSVPILSITATYSSRTWVDAVTIGGRSQLVDEGGMPLAALHMSFVSGQAIFEVLAPGERLCITMRDVELALTLRFQTTIWR